MDTKKCSCCKNDKPISDFNKNRSTKDGLHSSCRPCKKAMQKNWYLTHIKDHKKNVAVNKKKHLAIKRTKVAEYLSQHPCVDCGEDNVVVLDFDHVRGQKKNDVSRLVSNGLSWEVVQKEIEKCEVRCANCHRIKTHERRISRSKH